MKKEVGAMKFLFEPPQSVHVTEQRAEGEWVDEVSMSPVGQEGSVALSAPAVVVAARMSMPRSRWHACGREASLALAVHPQPANNPSAERSACVASLAEASDATTRTARATTSRAPDGRLTTQCLAPSGAQ